MKSTELRIGIWILDPTKKPVIVKNIQSDSFNLVIDGEGVAGSYLLEKYNGIPLTSDILEKAGFRSCTCGGWQDDNLHLRPGFIYSSANLEVKTVHQLQNLYFILTGEELVINLPG